MDRQSDPARGAGAVGLFYSDSEGGRSACS